jgi:hypothetical protein
MMLIIVIYVACGHPLLTKLKILKLYRDQASANNSGLKKMFTSHYVAVCWKMISQLQIKTPGPDWRFEMLGCRYIYRES